MQKAIDFIGRFINIKMGLAGALVMGVVVWIINYSGECWPATTAAMKQAAYTFIFGGILIKILDTICLKVKNRYLAITLSTILVSCTTIILVYLVHKMKGTPYPEASTLPTIIMAPPGFLALAIRNRWKS